VRYTTEERKQIAELEQRRIRTPQGYEVPLHSVAYIEYGAGLSDIKRTDGMRRVAVTAEVNTNKANTETIVSAMEKEFFKGLQAKYTGLYVDFQGEKKKSQESFASLKISFPLALIGIYVIIATAFRSYLQPIVVMITVPFGIIGAFLGHLALGFELSMMSLFGIVALAGVVVNDAIVLVECVNMLVAAGMPFREAIWRGGVRRFRAIFLTTATTVGGLAPLILEPDVQAQFLVPMAVSLAAGVAFATLLTLILLPCLLLVLNDLRRASHWIWYRRWPSREEVEPWVGEAASLASAQSHAVSAQPLSVVSP
jgi:multidrug efflux pump subunit AcrB